MRFLKKHGRRDVFLKKSKYLRKNHRPVYVVTCIYLCSHYWGVYIKMSYSQVTSKQEKHSLMKGGGTELSYKIILNST